MDNLEVEKWDKVYQTPAQDLPWFGVLFPLEVREYLDSLSKTEGLIVTGVGAGDTASNLYSQGFTNITGTDLSSVAIETAQKRFPNITFNNLATQDLATAGNLKNFNVFDWLNLHQISPENLSNYLRGLGFASKNLCLVWIDSSNGEETSESRVHSGSIYFHNPDLVKVELENEGMKLQKQFNFKFETNPRSQLVTYNAVGQIYSK